jgi:hypothetical protein
MAPASTGCLRMKRSVSRTSRIRMTDLRFFWNDGKNDVGAAAAGARRRLRTSIANASASANPRAYANARPARPRRAASVSTQWTNTSSISAA